MFYHSEEIWESFDALGRRVQQLSHIVRQMQARLDAIEMVGERDEAERFANISYEEEVNR
jgi:hypothetical protein